ncbi:MAG TPA: hypothetical protein VFD10_10480 [Atribacterota bacterium]|nr:hypothetical protein [Atribacterota bacterium]
MINTTFVFEKILNQCFFPLKILKIKNSAKHTLFFFGFRVEVVIKNVFIVIIVIKKEDINKGEQLYSRFCYKSHIMPTLAVSISIVHWG